MNAPSPPATPRRKPSSRSKTVHEDLYDQPGHLIRRAHQIAVGLFAELVGPDITPIQYAILRMVHESPGIDQVSLARCIALDTSTTALTAARLQGKGLLDRAVSTVDRRQLALTLTPDGEALIRRLVDRVHTMRERLLSPLDGHEQDLLMGLLAKFVRLNNEQSRAPLREQEHRSADGTPAPRRRKPRTAAD
ncbi:MarR family winged helix-turn-helix transcriptional regulator [Aquabacterium sp. J223]|uniref:MarR family winged helix-turn-helix transcriptional regulator n=1 Tax=Aquabacterium sp. J223 TaxID=2898431 RepID=UPI0021AD5F82|nr:MarR family transcriptional regulator [Aquabacterium sp. J223]UUX95466.1 MarR family transcriptional regulator [Aquabacterium sp. J223]